MITIRKRWALAVVTGVLAGVGIVMAQTDSPSNPQPNTAQPSEQMGQETTLIGQLETIHGFVTGRAAEIDAGKGATASPAPGSMANGNEDMNNPENSDKSANKSDRWAHGLTNEPLCLIETNGQCVILGQSWEIRRENQTGANASPNSDNSNPNNASANANAPETVIPIRRPVAPNSRTLTRLSQAHPWLNQQVNITGKLFSKSGVRYLDVESLSPAGTAQAPGAGASLSAANP